MRLPDVRGAAVLLGSVLAPATVNAQQAPPMQVVEVSGKADSYDPRRDDTATRIVVNHAELAKYGDASVLDALKRVPGVTVTSTGRGTDVRMRGMGAGYTQILLNGERAPAGFAIDSLAPALVERIEVLRAATADMGTDAIAGTINIVLRKVARKQQRELQFGLSGDRIDRTGRANLQMSDRDGRFSYSFGANLRTTWINRDNPFYEDGLDSQGQPDLRRATASDEKVRFDLVNLVPRLIWTRDNGDTLTSENFISINRSSFLAEQVSTTAFGIATAYPRLNWRSASRNASMKSDLIWSRKTPAGSRLDVKVGMRLADGDSASAQVGSLPAPATIPAYRSDTSASTKEHGVYTSGKFVTPLFDGHAISTGWEGSTSKREERQIFQERFLTSPIAPRNDGSFRVDVARFAAYAQDEWSIRPDLAIYLGYRWEDMRTMSNADRVESRNRISVPSPIVQALYKVPGTKGDQLRFAVTRTYKAPKLADLIPRRRRFEINSPTNPDLQGNPALKPERALGLDASYTHYWAKGALLSASVSSRQIDDYTVSRISRAADGRWVSSPDNAGSARTRGVELEAKFPLQSLIATAPALDLRASLSRNWSSVDSAPGPGNRIARQIPVSATLGVDYVRGALTTGGSFAFRNGGLSRESTAQSSYLSVRRDLDVFVLWKFDPKTQMRLALGNVLGEDDVTASAFATATGTVQRTTVTRGYVNARAFMELKF